MQLQQVVVDQIVAVVDVVEATQQPWMWRSRYWRNIKTRSTKSRWWTEQFKQATMPDLLQGWASCAQLLVPI
uniref:Uncharacterized protein n=1 Tax=Arundo donax TaxID=35708 RepID=A0A0A8XXE7_ARUDO